MTNNELKAKLIMLGWKIRDPDYLTSNKPENTYDSVLFTGENSVLYQQEQSNLPCQEVFNKIIKEDKNV